MKPKRLDQLAKLDPEIVEHFLKTGKSSGISKQLQSYILQLDLAGNLLAKGGNIMSIARQIKSRFPKLDIRTCQNRITEAMQIFYGNKIADRAAWNNYYADRFENLATVAIASDDLSTAFKCVSKAHALRMENIEDNIPEDLLKMKEIILTPDIAPERLGFSGDDYKNIFKESKELINKTKVSKEVKERLILEVEANLNIQDAEIIE